MDSQNLFLLSAKKRMSEHASAHGHDLEYLEGALEWLMRFTRAQLNAEDRESYLMRLATYPKSKLLMLTDFNGRLSEVWKFLDDVRIQPERIESPREEIGYSQKQLEHNPRKEMAKDCFAYIKRLFGTEEVKEQDQIEREFVLAMREKYPAYTWIATRKTNENAPVLVSTN